MAQIDPFRMLGRFDGAIEFLMQKYNLGLAVNIPDYPTLLMALSSKVNDYDRAFCIRMADASMRYVEETQNTSLSQFQIDHQKSIGEDEAKFIFRNFMPNYADAILSDHDYLDDIEEEKRQKNKEIKRNIWLGLGVIAAIVAAIIVYNLPYFAEQRAFDKVVDAYEREDKIDLDFAVNHYLQEYPDGKHKSEVLFYPVKIVRYSNDAVMILSAVDDYLHQDPKGIFSNDCKQISDSIWNVEIKKYEAAVAASQSKKGVQFVVEMLNYMKSNNVRTVEVTGNPILKLKEYKEYPAHIRYLIEEYTKGAGTVNVLSGKRLKLPDDLLTIKDKIPVEDAQKWVKYIVEALQEGFDKVLTPGLVVFETVTDPIYKDDRTRPKVMVDYIVKNQEIEKDVPDIWEHTQSQGSVVYPVALFLGIAMSFDANFTLPGKNESYNVKGEGDPGDDDIKGVDTDMIYKAMCMRSTMKFADKIVEEFGLTE